MINKTNLVSVIIPTYNRAHTILRALNSVKNQNYRPIEVIIVDDGSKDGTDELLKKYDFGNLIVKKLKNEKNLGISASRNKGILFSAGSYIAFLDSDDEWIRGDKITLQVSFLEKNLKYGFVSCSTITADMHFPPNFLGESNDVDFRKKALQWCPYQTSSWMIRKNIIDKIGFFWNRKCEDYEYLLRVGSVTKCAGLKEICNIYHNALEGDNRIHKILCYFTGLLIIFNYRSSYTNFFKSLFLRFVRGVKYGLRYFSI